MRNDLALKEEDFHGNSAGSRRLMKLPRNEHHHKAHLRSESLLISQYPTDHEIIPQQLTTGSLMEFGLETSSVLLLLALITHYYFL